MRTKSWITAALLPAGVLAFWMNASAQLVDCTGATITCATFTEGRLKLKPALSPNACPPGVTDLISIRGTFSDCTLTGAGTVRVVSGALRGSISTPDCTCAELPLGAHPTLGGSLTTTWKFATADAMGNALALCTEKVSTLVLSPAARVAVEELGPGPLEAIPMDSIHAIYGVLSLNGTGLSVSGPFQGEDGGTTSVFTAITTESVEDIAGSCLGPKKLTGFRFGQAEIQLK